MRRAIAALFLGAVASILIAWGVDLADQQWKRSRPGAQRRVEPNPSSVARWRWFVTPDHRLGRRRFTFRIAAVEAAMDTDYAASPEAAPVDEFPRWVRVPSQGMYMESSAFGLPFPCLARQNVNSPEPRDLIDFTAFGRRRLLATRPVWIGWAADTLLLGAMSYPLTLIPRSVARQRRRQKGQCPLCGYDLRASETGRCPECGPRR